MTGGTRGARFLTMSLMTGEATEPFVNADGSSVIAAANFHAHYGGVALVAQSLANVGAEFYQAVAIAHRRQRKLVESDVVELAPVKQR